MKNRKREKKRKHARAANASDGLDAAQRKPSGAEYRKRRKERELAERSHGGTEAGERQTLLQQIGDLPLGDPDTAMPWFRRAQIVLLGELLKDPEMSVRELFTAVKQMSEAAGKTGSSAALEARLAAVEAALAGTRAKGAVEVKGTNGLPRPPTARGGSRARGPPTAGRISAST